MRRALKKEMLSLAALLELPPRDEAEDVHSSSVPSRALALGAEIPVSLEAGISLPTRNSFRGSSCALHAPTTEGHEELEARRQDHRSSIRRTHHACVADARLRDRRVVCPERSRRRRDPEQAPREVSPGNV